MRSTPIFFALSLTVVLAACGSVDEPPLGGPFGGSTDPTDPNGTNNDNGDNNNGDNGNTSDDAGATSTDDDSGATQTKDSGTTQTKDAGTQTQDSGTQTQNAPTWTQIFDDYLASGTKGDCVGCHSQGSTASKLYTWMQGQGQINGTSSKIAKSGSRLSWFGGNMPPNGPSSYGNAASDTQAWVAAGALNN